MKMLLSLSAILFLTACASQTNTVLLKDIHYNQQADARIRLYGSVAPLYHVLMEANYVENNKTINIGHGNLSPNDFNIFLQPRKNISVGIPDSDFKEAFLRQYHIMTYKEFIIPANTPINVRASSFTKLHTNYNQIQTIKCTGKFTTFKADAGQDYEVIYQYEYGACPFAVMKIQDGKVVPIQ